MKQYKNGGIVVMMPLFDKLKAKPPSLETEDFNEFYDYRRKIN